MVKMIVTITIRGLLFLLGKCNVREVRRNLADRQTKTEDLPDNYQGQLSLESLKILCLIKGGECQYANNF